MGFIGPVGDPGIVGEKVRLLATNWLLELLQDEGEWGGRNIVEICHVSATPSWECSTSRVSELVLGQAKIIHFTFRN